MGLAPRLGAGDVGGRIGTQRHRPSVLDPRVLLRFRYRRSRLPICRDHSAVALAGPGVATLWAGVSLPDASAGNVTPPALLTRRRILRRLRRAKRLTSPDHGRLIAFAGHLIEERGARQRVSRGFEGGG